LLIVLCIVLVIGQIPSGAAMHAYNASGFVIVEVL